MRQAHHKLLDRRCRRSLLRRLFTHPLECTLALVLAGTPLGGAFAAPQGPQVQGGQISFQGLGTKNTTINQSSQNGIINWYTFNVGTGETVTFNQLNANSNTLNRVTGGLGPSQIFGSITANGRIFLVNPDGILFGRGSSVNAASFLATTHDISNADFMSNTTGRFNFNIPGRLDASIVNLGHISATNGGFAALVAPGVRNNGVITANLGHVALASGNGFTLDFYGDKLITLQVGDQIANQVIDVATGERLSALVKNSGRLQANGGTVSLTAVAARHVVDSVINNRGVIEANTVGTKNGMIVLGAATAATKPADTPTQKVKVSGILSAKGGNDGEKGGTIVIRGEAVTLRHAKIDASGTAGGGTARIRGDNITVARGGLIANGLDSLTLSSSRNIDVDAPIVIRGDGSLTLRADNTGTGIGTVRFGERGSIDTPGAVTIFYNPSSSEGASHTAVNSYSYTTPTDYSQYVTGGGPLTAYMLVNTVYDLQNMQNNLGGTYALGRNIDASVTAGWNKGQGFVPIGNDDRVFVGTLDGQGHMIDSLVINRPESNDVGLFSRIGFGGMVANLGIVSGAITGNFDVGPLAGSNFGTVTQSYATSSVTGNGSVGGLVGFNSGLVTLSHATGQVTGIGSDDVGGLVGLNGGTITQSYATGNVSGPLDVGGLVGDNSGGHITQSYATGTITGTNTFFDFGVGGLVGFMFNGTISQSYATGAVSAPAYVGGLVGWSTGSIDNSYATGAVNGSSNVGGFVGWNAGSISNSYAAGAATGTSIVGGFAGWNVGSINNSYATGAVSGSSNVGGFVGVNDANDPASFFSFLPDTSATIRNSYSAGAVSSASQAGGFTGANNGSIVGSFWDVSTSGYGAHNGVGNRVDAPGVTGLTTAQFGDTSLFTAAGWTFGATPGGQGWVVVDVNGTLNNANGAAGATRPMLLSEWSTTITNAHQLELVNLDLNAHYKLANDIDLGAALANRSSVFGPNDKAGFVPIGQLVSFGGTFDGQGHTIAGLAMAPSAVLPGGVVDIGLFGVNQGTIRNLHLTDVAITLNADASVSLQDVGTVAAANFGTIDHVTASGAINGQNAAGVFLVGGLVGTNLGSFSTSVDEHSVALPGLIRHSSADVAITLGGAGCSGVACIGIFDIAGGLAGANSGTIRNSSASGNIAVSSPNAVAGGLVGENVPPEFGGTGGIFNSFATGNVSSPAIDVLLGGLVGLNSSGAVIRNSRATGTVSSTAAVPANCFSNACQFVFVGGLVGENFGLVEGRRLPSSADSGCRAGFTCASGTVSAGERGQAGGLVGFNGGTIQVAFATGPVDVGANGSGGGLVGFNVGTVRRSFATGNVTGAAGTGIDHGTTLAGLVAQNQGMILHSFATGSVGVSGVDHLDAGGLVGENAGVIRYSHATGDVRAGNFSAAGGLAAQNNPGGQDCGDCKPTPAKISHSSATGDVVVGSSSVAGGLVGVNNSMIRHSGAGGNVRGADNSILGGLVGVNNLAALIGRSVSWGSVTSTGPNSVVAGLVGLNGGDIRDSRSSASVSAADNSYVGGSVGINIGTVVDTQVHDATVVVSGTGNLVGGFVGANMGLIDPSTTDAVPQAGPGNVVGSFAGANLSFDPSIFSGLTVPPPSFPAGSISSDSQNTSAAPNQPPFTGTTTAANNPGTPGVISSCSDAICQIFQTGFLTPSQPPPPPQPPPSSPCSAGQGTSGQCGQNSPIDTPPPPQTVIAPPTFADISNQPTLVNLTTGDNGGGAGGTGNGGNHNGNNSGNNNGGSNGAPRSPGPPPGAGLGRTLDEQRFSGVPPIGETRFRTGELVVQVSNTVPLSTVLQLAQELGITLIASQNVDINGRVIYRFKAANGKDIRILIRALEKKHIVASAQPNYTFRLSQSAPAPAVPPAAQPPSEPDLANANTASLETLPVGDSAQYVIDKMHLVQIHGMARGRGVVVAVIDSEIDANHPDLKGVIVERFDATQSPSHPHPHGTGMAGAIAAHKRLLGVAPGVRLIAIKAFDEQASSAEATSFQILRGLDYAIEHKARIINMSFAGPRDPMMERALKIAHDKGIILVAAAGNAGPKSPPLYPGADKNVIAVTASDYNDRPFTMANRGSYIAVAAPGVDVMVPAPNNTYQLTTGTSVATAHISGVAALLVERKPTITPDEVRAILMRTATPYSARPKGEQDGAGLVDPAAALRALGPAQAAANAPRAPAPALH